MTKQRKRLKTLTNKLNYYQSEIQNLTTHPNGMSYGRCIRELIYSYIDPDYSDPRLYNMTPSVYAKYQKLHAEVARISKNKSQVYTQDEYVLVLNHMKNVWNYNIPDAYLLNI